MEKAANFGLTGRLMLCYSKKCAIVGKHAMEKVGNGSRIVVSEQNNRTRELSRDLPVPK